ncbi:OsmC family protein [Buchananella felis]|uniref:OsmC family protein n=1 Tax=Buchananella felis TaxID=3231492 RepID=UPI003529B0A5
MSSNALWATRTGNRSYVGRNANGAEVLIGDEPGMFSPGELLRLALATCHTLSADKRLAAALGEAFSAHVGVDVVKPEGENRYSHFEMEFLTDLSALDDAARATLMERVEGAIERNCTIGHTLANGATYNFAVVDEASAQ